MAAIKAAIASMSSAPASLDLSLPICIPYLVAACRVSIRMRLERVQDVKKVLRHLMRDHVKGAVKNGGVAATAPPQIRMPHMHFIVTPFRRASGHDDTHIRYNR